MLLFAGAFLLALLLTHRVRGWSLQYGLVDVPDHGRHDHDRPIARSGGIAVFVTVTLVLGLVFAVRAPESFGSHPFSTLLVVMAGGAGIFALGLWDDARSLSARTKFPVQVLVALMVFIAGVRIESVPLVEFASGSLPLAVSLPLTVLWIVGVTNAFNLIDGSDGVAAGAAVVACAAMAAISLVNGNELGVVVSFVLGGAALGFLCFNFPPASIFLGDSGSLFIGYMLAAMAVVTTQTAETAVAVAIPLVALGLPILDTFLVIVRRFLRRKPIFQGDRRHIHHVLRDLGLSPRRVALLIYAVCSGFALLSILLVQPGGPRLSGLFVAVGLVLGIGVQRLRIPELVELGQIVGRSMAQREVIAHNMRIRDATAQMRRARDAAAAMAALESAFEGSEFQRVELWLPAELAAPLLRDRSVWPSDGGYLWRWAAPAPFREERSFEVRLPFRDESGRRIGRLSLWRPLGGQRLFTDIRLVANELLPAFEHGLKQIREAPSITNVPVQAWTNGGAATVPVPATNER